MWKQNKSPSSKTVNPDTLTESITLLLLTLYRLNMMRITQKKEYLIAAALFPLLP